MRLGLWWRRGLRRVLVRRVFVLFVGALVFDGECQRGGSNKISSLYVKKIFLECAGWLMFESRR